MASSSGPTQEEIEKINRLKGELQQYMEKTAELELERDEHQIVLDAMKPMDPTRKCFRQISGVLVEGTVSEFTPALQVQLEGIQRVMQSLVTQRDQKEQELKQYQASITTKSS